MHLTQEAKSNAFAEQRLQNLASSVLDDKILTLVVETVSLCNLSCNFCDAHSGRAPEFKQRAGHMDDVTWDNLICSLECYVKRFAPIPMIQFFGNGEPLLDKHLANRIAQVKSLGLSIKTRVITNGTLLSPSLVDKLIDSGLDEIHVSLDIVDSQKYREVKGLDMCHTVLDNIKRAVPIFEERCSAELFIKYFIPSDKLTAGGGGGDDLNYGVCKSDGLLVEELFHQATISSKYVHLKSQKLVDAGINHLEGRVLYSQPCEIPFYLLYIKHDGNISACCTDVFSALNVGCLKTSNLLDILIGRELASIRLKHLKGQSDQIPLCAGCGNRTASNISSLPSKVLEDIEQSLVNKIGSTADQSFSN